MTWKINFSEEATKFLKKADKTLETQILKYFKKIIDSNQSPTSFGKPLVANKVGLWRYRVSNFRIICVINNNELIILVLQIANRSEIYK